MSRYVPISDFGCGKITNKNEPLTMCMTDTMDIGFMGGSAAARNYGPRSFKCQAYMAERCAKNYDGYCDYFYIKNSQTNNWPNNQKWASIQGNNWQGNFGLNTNLTIGEQLLSNTADRKYCVYPNCAPIREPFNPMDPASPMVTYYARQNQVPICTVDKTTIDSDPVMNRCLANPSAAASTLVNICNTSKNQGIDLSGTKIGAFCDRYFAGMSEQGKPQSNLLLRTVYEL